MSFVFLFWSTRLQLFTIVFFTLFLTIRPHPILILYFIPSVPQSMTFPCKLISGRSPFLYSIRLRRPSYEGLLSCPFVTRTLRTPYLPLTTTHLPSTSFPSSISSSTPRTVRPGTSRNTSKIRRRTTPPFGDLQNSSSLQLWRLDPNCSE